MKRSRTGSAPRQAPGKPDDPKALAAAVDAYLDEHLFGRDPVLDAALEDSRAAGLPPINVSASQGKLLQLLVRLQHAVHVLEIGTLGAYSTIWLARALPANGRVVTLEAEAKHVEVARANLARAGLLGVVDVRLGPALETLARIEREGHEPFDLVFIDADKPSTPDYIEASLRLSRPGTLLVVDNVVRSGELANGATTDASVHGMQRAVAMMAAHPRLEATVIQTVGAKGYDGFALGLVGE
jgi:predicted O-methyltransferase YrrM